MKKKTIRHRYIQTFGVMVIALALVRCGYLSLTGGSDDTGVMPVAQALAPADDNTADDDDTTETDNTTEAEATPEAVQETSPAPVQEQAPAMPPIATSKRYLADGDLPHPIKSVPNYAEAFPDSNHVQLSAATRWGVSPVKNRQNAELRKEELVYMGLSPYYHVDPLQASIPYLVPRAAILVQDIGKAFYDSLHVKGLPLHRLIVTSVLRTQDDVTKLRRYNRNATEQSCHLYGTTIDICYNRYQPVEVPGGASRRRVRDDSLKYVLSEVLNDMRRNGRCYVKYEHRQGCFHLTVR